MICKTCKDKGRDFVFLIIMSFAVRYTGEVSLASAFLFFLFIALAVSAGGAELDDDLVEKLKIEANHNLNRLRSYKDEVKNNQIHDSEREKALAEFLEEQERWELLRERGLTDYLKQKKVEALTENSPEFRAYQKELELQEKEYEKSRQRHLRTMRAINNSHQQELQKLESQELQLYSDRPRFDLRKRLNNKWAKTSSSTRPGQSTGFVPPTPPVENEINPGFQDVPQLPINTDLPPMVDFPSAPQPYEVYDEGQIPPQVYDGNVNNPQPYDPSFGGVDYSNPGLIPPPPPPPPEFDF